MAARGLLNHRLCGTQTPSGHTDAMDSRPDGWASSTLLALTRLIDGPKKTGRWARFFFSAAHSTGLWNQNGKFMSFKSFRVSTKTKGPSFKVTAGGRSRGTRGGLISAAMAACTAATLATSEFTQTKPEPCATCSRLSICSV